MEEVSLLISDEEFEDGTMRKYLLIALFLLTVMGVSWYAASSLLSDSEQAVLVEETVERGTEEAGAAPSGRIMVYVSGAVRKPGVYEMPSGSRAYEAVEAAGNVLPYADVDHVNLAAMLADGEQFHVPLDPSRVTQSGTEPLVNINTAGKTELDSLPGVGEVTAQKILEYRNEHGPFQTKEDIKNVPSIGDGKYAKLADRITV